MRFYLFVSDYRVHTVRTVRTVHVMRDHRGLL